MSNTFVPNQVADAEQNALAMIERLKQQKEGNAAESFFQPEALEQADAGPTNPEPEFEVPQFTQEPEVEATPEVAVEAQVEAPVAKDKIDPSDWKARFSGYKAKTDTTIYELRQQQKQLKDALDAQQKQNEELAKNLTTQAKSDYSVPDGTLTPELADELGKDGIDAVSRVAAAMAGKQVAALEARLDQMNQQLAATQQENEAKSQQQSTNEFFKSVITLVPDLYVVDADEGFVNYLNGHDQFGQHRRQLCQAAMNNGDVHGFARFYIDYKKQSSTNAKEALVTPRQSGANAPTQAKGKSSKIWRKGEFANMAKLVSLGKISQKEFNAAQVDYTNGIHEGRVRM